MGTKNAPRSAAGGHQGGDHGRTVPCSNEDALVRGARDWSHWAHQYPSEITIRGFEQAVGELVSVGGREARQLEREARRIRQTFNEWTGKAMRLALQHGYVAPVYGFDLCRPIVRGFLSVSGIRVRCPFHPQSELHPAGRAAHQYVVSCEHGEYVVQPWRIPLLIPPTIPGRQP
jgi:hypothetical protein